eukprot:TRINITY_DN7572_c1_g1_i2.p2 TRINITY_DN7572_c1_g1~~TRINITY_DN7572_c1_g1_i2.p2  ORF type:complete len:319 (+),score=18.21 TRINITY_DN7572_c1_g1_i2:31-987(+)
MLNKSRYLCMFLVLSLVQAQVDNRCEYDRVNPECNMFQWEIIGPDAILGSNQDWPYMVSLQLNARNRPSQCFEHKCGGVLISPTLVLTAAHCITHTGILLSTEKEGTPRRDLFAARIPKCRHQADDERIQVKKVWVDPQWNNLIADIAILQLSDPFKSFDGPYVNYKDSFTYNLNQPKQNLQVAGWGISEDEDAQRITRYSVDPFLEAPVSYSSAQICQFLLIQFANRDGRGSNISLAYDDRYMFCTFNSKADTCRGDSGGPLISRGDDPSKDILLGIVSWGPSECESNSSVQAPQVYVRVSQFVSWIDQIVAQVENS